MNFWRSSAGVIEAELTSAALEDAVAGINALGIDLLSLDRCSDLTCRFQILRKEYPVIKALAEKRGEVLRLVRRKGLYWRIRSLIKRPVLAAGLCLMGGLVLTLPSRVLFVRVAGNQEVPGNRILEAAETCGVEFGASRRAVRSEKVKNAILAEIPQLQWVGVNTAGCLATVSVKERAAPEKVEEKYQVSSIIAARDGFLTSATVIRGNPLFQIGQAVQKGQVLVSGYTDCGICIQATRSEAEIYAQTNHRIHAVTPETCGEIQDTGRARRTISLLFRKKRINLWKDSGISPTTCGRMYKEYYLTLPGGFVLPAALCIDTYVPYETAVAPVLEFQAEEALDRFVRNYLPSQMAAGEILSGSCEVALEEGGYHLRGHYICEEMIGREQQEQIGEENGKND